jgi:tRNA A-37 threonylcarbamoyl transferase component Bud32/FixJ family two-component response regulator
MNAPTEALPPEAYAALARPSKPTCLVVHDDPELRHKLADLVARTALGIGVDLSPVAGLDAMPEERLGSYIGVLLMVEFMRRDGGVEPTELIARTRSRVPSVPLFVIARDGDERCAVRAVKAGAADYWPIYSLSVSDLATALRPLQQPQPRARRASAAQAPSAQGTGTAGAPHIEGYRLQKRLAHSSTASVYLAHSEALSRTVALKLQSIDHNASASDRQRFVRECEILSRLNHRSVADIIDFGITPDYLYLALEYFPCGSLRERLRNPVSAADAIDYARQIAEALQVVHAAGVCHRDVKPSNLMLTAENRVVLIDFGSARAPLVSADGARSTQTTATPYYVCPEHLAGADPDPRFDLYSLGIIFYEMLAGEPPFRGTNLAEIFERHRGAPVPQLDAEHRACQPLINRLLEKNPADRYASAADFLEALEGLETASVT